MSDPLAGFELDLDPQTLSGDLERFDLPIRSDDDGFLAYLGLYDLLARRTQEELGPDARARLSGLALRLQGLEGPMRFALYDRSQQTETLSRVARITAGESRLKRGWLIPKLEADVALYRRRVAALSEALEAT
jgi:hypothetical protein